MSLQLGGYVVLVSRPDERCSFHTSRRIYDSAVHYQGCLHKGINPQPARAGFYNCRKICENFEERSSYYGRNKE